MNIQRDTLDNIDIQKTYCVYMHTSPSGKSYIGITCRKPPEKRWSNGNGYRRGHPYFWKAICKYGWNNFRHSILFDGLTQQQACEKEQEMITLYDTTNPNKGYNMTSGGEGKGGYITSEETKHKISQSRIGRFTGKDNPNYGNHKIAGQNNPFYGKTHSEETKKKLKQIATGRPSPMKGKHFSDKARNNMKLGAQNRCKPVMQYDLDGNLIATYRSLSEAHEVTGYNKSNISACCLGRTKTCNGFIWRYKSNE